MSGIEVCDVLVIGAGMAGASIAALLAQQGRSVVVLEREDMPGYHTTGRSAALFSEIYGNEIVRALTRASRSFLYGPPAGFSDATLIRPRGLLYTGDGEGARAFKDFAARPDVAMATRSLDAAEGLALCPILRPEVMSAVLYEPDAGDLDVHALHQGYLRLLRRHAGRVITSAKIAGLEFSRSRWIVRLENASFEAPFVVNAAGAWADDVAELAGARRIGVEPRRRTVAIVDPPAGMVVADWPMVVDMAEDYYFKPETGALLLSSCDETLSEPCDAQPEEIDIAIAVDHFERATTHRIGHIRRKWAGLRTFVPDHSPVVGFDPERQGFFWFAAQGGFGIQMAPALARLGASLLLDRDSAAILSVSGVSAGSISPGRLVR